MNNDLPSFKNSAGSNKGRPACQRRVSFLLWIRDYAIKPFHQRAGLALAAITLLPTTSHAEHFVVKTLFDSPGTGDLSLREAITAANGNNQTDTITFASDLAGVLTLTQGALDITSSLTITGPGDSIITISGDADSSGDASDGDSRIFTTAGSVFLSNLTLSNGFASGDNEGGAIYNEISLTITNMIFSGNSSEDNGGAIRNKASMTISDSIFTGNSSSGDGGAIFNGASLTISNSIFTGNSSDNSGGTIRNFGTIDSITNSTFSHNSANRNGGAISSLGIINMINSTFSNNSAGRDGGAIDNLGIMDMVNSTLSGNSTTRDGGAIFNNGRLSVTHSTLSGNSADIDSGGIHNNTAGSLTIANSIVAGNQSQNPSSSNIDGIGTTNTLGTNIFSTSGTGDNDDLIETNLANIFASLCQFTLTDGTTFRGGSLTENGGLVETILIRPGGVADNVGDNSVLPEDEFDLDNDGDSTELLPSDARGFSRIFENTVDIGAVELRSFEIPDLEPTVLSLESINAQDGATLTFNINPNAPSGTTWNMRRATSLDNIDAASPILTFDGTSVTLNESGNSSNLDASTNIFTLIDSDPPNSEAFYRLEVNTPCE